MKEGTAKKIDLGYTLVNIIFFLACIIKFMK